MEIKFYLELGISTVLFFLSGILLWTENKFINKKTYKRYLFILYFGLLITSIFICLRRDISNPNIGYGFLAISFLWTGILLLTGNKFESKKIHKYCLSMSYFGLLVGLISICLEYNFCNPNMGHRILGTLFILVVCGIILLGDKFESKKTHKDMLWLLLGILFLASFFMCIEYAEHGRNHSADILSGTIIFSFIGLLGVSITLWGLRLTYEQTNLAYEQAKMQEDKIESYNALYKALDELLNDELSSKFQYYGATLLPGHIAYKNKADINNYKKSLKNTLKLNKKIEGKAEVIILNDKLIKDAYNTYKDETIYEKLYGKDEIVDCLQEINDLKDDISKNCQVYEIQYATSKILDNFYFSNGHIVIYAVPLHYQVKKVTDASNSTDKNEPFESTLIGYKTTSLSIIKAFEARFKELKTGSEEYKSEKKKQHEILLYMYSKYFVNAEYIEKKLELDGLSLRECQSDKLYELDQDHFLGLETTKKCIEKVATNSNDSVLDIGSGFGGVCRFIAETTGAKVTGIEIQKDRFDFAIEATKIFGLNDKVSFVNEDFISTDLKNNTYSKVIALLSILHIINKKTAIHKISNILKPAGIVYIEDYYKMKLEFSKDEENKLLKTISCPNLLSKYEYLSEFEKNKIKIVFVEDLTKIWKEVVTARYNDFRDNFKSYRTKFGDEKTLKALDFATGVSELFDNGIIYGFRVIGKKMS